jgi:hypothetical protein
MTGTAASALLQSSIGALGGTAGNSTGSIASFGGTTTNATELGVRLWRQATGSDWTTSAVVLSMDVDNTYGSGSRFTLDHSKFFGFNTETPAYLVDLYNPSASRVFHVDSSGNAVSDGGGYFSGDHVVMNYAASGDYGVGKPGSAEVRRLYNANNRPGADSGVLEGDILFNG